MAYASSLSDALVHVPDIAAGLSASTTLTTTQATTIWGDVVRAINCALEGAGIATPITPSTSEGYKTIAAIERLWTSGEVLRAVHGIADSATAAQVASLLARAKQMLDKITSDPSILSALGVTSVISSAVRSTSYAVENPDPNQTTPDMPEPEFGIEDEL